VVPGVGDYSPEKALVKSPRCTIGNSQRFERLSAMQNYKTLVPVSYQSNVQKDSSAPKRKLGVIGSAPRWGRVATDIPGPGEYNT